MSNLSNNISLVILIQLHFHYIFRAFIKKKLDFKIKAMSLLLTLY